MKQSPHQTAKSSRTLGIAQEAASALASIRKDAESIKRKMHRPANLGGDGRPANLGGDGGNSPMVTSTPHGSERGRGAYKPPINR